MRIGTRRNNPMNPPQGKKSKHKIISANRANVTPIDPGDILRTIFGSSEVSFVIGLCALDFKPKTMAKIAKIGVVISRNN